MSRAERRDQDAFLDKQHKSQCRGELLIPEAAYLATPEDRWFRVLMEGNTGYKPPTCFRTNVRERQPYEEPKGCGCTRCGCWRPFNASLAVGGSCHCPEDNAPLSIPEPEPFERLPRCVDCGELLPPPKRKGGRKRGDLCQRCRQTANQASYRERQKQTITRPQSCEIIILEACAT